MALNDVDATTLQNEVQAIQDTLELDATPSYYVKRAIACCVKIIRLLAKYKTVN